MTATTTPPPPDATPGPSPAPSRARPATPATVPAHSRWGIGHLPALDGLRGAAVAAVLLYHGGYLKGGYLGVDLFFVLSGFLITSLLLAEHRGTATIGLRDFWTRRARRLLPALFGLIFGTAVYAWVWARPIDLGGIRASGIAALLYVANWQQIIHGTNYWDISLSPSPLQHVWSLAIEEQFYVVWPLVIAWILKGGGRHRGRRVQNVCLALAALSAGWFIALHALGASDTRVYQGTDTRAFALLLGAALAGWRAENGPVEEQADRQLIEVVGIVAAVLLGAAWLFLAGTSALLYAGGLPICSVLATVVLWAASSRTSPVLAKVFSARGLRFLGTISYGLYLWHWPIYLVLNEGRTGLSGLLLLALRLATSLAFALISFHLLEQPIRKGALRQPVPRLLAIAGAVLSVVALLWSTAGAVDPKAVNQVAAPAQAAATIAGAPTVMVVGDSVGNSVAGPIIDDPWSYGVNPVNRAVIGCELMFKGNTVRLSNGTVETRPDCTASYRADVAAYRPDVALVFFGGANSGEVGIDGSYVQPCDPAFRDAQVRLHRDAVADLASSGAKVVLVTLARTDNTGFFPPPWNENITCYNDTLRQVAKETGAGLVDLDAWICPDGNCRKDIDGSPIRPDGLHFNGPGGRAVSKWLVDEALAVAGKEPSPVAAKVPAACAELRHATSPILGVIDQTSGDARRSSLDRLQYVDLGKTAAAAPAAAAEDLQVLADQADAWKQVLRSTPDGTKLTLGRFSPEVATALGNLQRYLDATCTGR